MEFNTAHEFEVLWMDILEAEKSGRNGARRKGCRLSRPVFNYFVPLLAEVSAYYVDKGNESSLVYGSAKMTLTEKELRICLGCSHVVFSRALEYAPCFTSKSAWTDRVMLALSVNRRGEVRTTRTYPRRPPTRTVPRQSVQEGLRQPG